MSDDTMPREWCRGPQFAGEAERKEWAPVIRSAQEAWATIELVSVSRGLRPSALVFLDANELVTASRDASGVGLSVVPLSGGQQFRAAVTAPALAHLWHGAWGEGNDELIGQLLGFPECCRAKFAEVWIARRARDQAPYCGAFEGPWEANILLRHLGVRAVPHLPCSGSCAATLAQARAYLDAGREAGADVASIERLLRLPLTYDAVNGVAIVDAGPFRFMHGTDNDPGVHYVERRAGQPGPETTVSGPPSWADNGFSTAAAMDAAHETVLRAAHEPGERPDSWLDLGAGDGALLARLARGGRGVAVELDAQVCARGRQRHPGLEFWPGTIQDYLAPSHLGLADNHGERFEALLLMPGRLLEMAKADRPAAVAALRGLARRVLVYAYVDWLGRGGLGTLCAQAGLGRVGLVRVGAGGAAQAAWLEDWNG